jgi:hypothetical protein
MIPIVQLIFARLLREHQESLVLEDPMALDENPFHPTYEAVLKRLPDRQNNHLHCRTELLGRTCEDRFRSGITASP